MTDLQTWTDLNGQYDLTTDGTPPTLDADAFDGVQGVRFSGSEFLDADFTSTLEQPYTVACTMEANTPGGHVLSGLNDTERADIDSDYEGNITMWAGNIISGPPGDTDPHVLICVFDGADSVLRVDGEEYTGDAGTNNLSGITVGSRHSHDDFFDGWLGELRVYNDRLGADRRESLHTELDDIWMYEPATSAESPVGGTLVFEDQFDQGSLDTTTWEVGFGWGMTSDNDDADVSADRVWVDSNDDQLVLEVYHEGGGNVTQGAINSGDPNAAWDGTRPTEGLDVGPGMYIETRMQVISREGILPAFWTKPQNENWPPEIDIFELFHEGRSSDPYTAHFNVHYSTSTACNDSSTHEQTGSHTATVNEPLDQNFHRFGAAWYTDRVEFYLDGNHIYTMNDSTAASALNNSGCLPHYLMFSNHVNRIGTPDYSSSWLEETRVDYVRVYDLG